VKRKLMDEITAYLKGRYMCKMGVMWRTRTDFKPILLCVYSSREWCKN